MQMKKHSLLFIALMSTTSLYANIPIESRGLSQNDGSASNTSSSNISVPTNLNWELMQNQQLENDIRTLRGQLEEQANDIEQLKKDLANRYTDLDQRLELLHQKLTLTVLHKTIVRMQRPITLLLLVHQPLKPQRVIK